MNQIDGMDFGGSELPECGWIGCQPGRIRCLE